MTLETKASNPPRGHGRRADDKAAQEFQLVMEELQLSQIEIEKQNRELFSLHGQLQESHNRYVDLYEFAPVLYMTLSLDGRVLDINLRGASFLHSSTSKIENRLFSDFLAHE